MRSLLSALLVYSIFLFQVGPVYAEAESTPIATASAETTAAAGDTEESSSSNSYQDEMDAEATAGVEEGEQTVQEGIAASMPENPDLAFDVVFMFITGLLVFHLVKSCWQSNDGENICNKISPTIYGISGIIYILGEIITYINYEEGSDATYEEYKDLEEDEQKEAFTAAQDQTQQAADAAEEKADWLEIAAMGTTIAAVIAVVEGVAQIICCGVVVLACCGGLCTNTTCLGEEGTSTVMNSVFPMQEPEEEYNPILNPFMENHSYDEIALKYLNESKTDVDSLFLYKELKSFQSGGLSSPCTSAYENQAQVFTLIEDTIPEEVRFKDFFSFAINFNPQTILNSIFPSAHALDASILGSLGGVVGGTLAVVGVTGGYALSLKGAAQALKDTMNKFIKMNAFTRASIFGVMAGHMSKLQGDAMAAAGQLQARAAIYGALAQATALRGIGDINLDLDLSNIPQDIDIPQYPDAIDLRPPTTQVCVSGSQTSPSYDVTCGGTPMKTNIPTMNFNGAIEVPPVVTSSAGLFGDTANALFSGNLKTANIGANKLKAAAGRLKKAGNNIKSSADKLLKKKGKPTLKSINGKDEFAKVIKAFNDDWAKIPADKKKALFDIMNRDSSLARTGKSSGKSKNAFGNNTGSGSGSGKKSGVDGQKVASAASPSRLSSPGSGYGGSGSKKGSGFSLDFDDDEENGIDPNAISAADATATAESEEGKSKYMVGDQDIHKGSNVSIFKIITGRYFKSAYPKFFNRKKSFNFQQKKN